jgi:three-Cys-motif partner protein
VESEASPRGNELHHLKRVSRVKHVILEKYFPSWAKILGSRNMRLAYVDCFAGPGQYELDGYPVEGSPLIVIREGIKFAQSNNEQSLALYLVDDDPRQVQRLDAKIKTAGFPQYPKNLHVKIICKDSRSFVPEFLERVGLEIPAFFLIDPYGHPLPIPIINGILRRPRAEVFINLMWFQINRDLNNPKVEARLNQLFGNSEWREQKFMQLHGAEREVAFLNYFKSQLDCKFVLQFRIRHDREDSHSGERTKYYLLHASNHVKAALLMKEVMWPLGDEPGTFDFSDETQRVLISETPPEEELREYLLSNFRGKELTFDKILEYTWHLPFIPKHYLSVLRQLEGKEITISRVTSKRTGISGLDLIRFK